jgi:hypothetical protein
MHCSYKTPTYKIKIRILSVAAGAVTRHMQSEKQYAARENE